MNETPFEQLQAAYNARPFKPFKVILDDGTKLAVEEPFFIGWSESGNRLRWSNQDDWFDDFPLSRLAGVEPMKSPARSGGGGKRPNRPNGSRRRRGDAK